MERKKKEGKKKGRKGRRRKRRKEEGKKGRKKELEKIWVWNVSFCQNDKKKDKKILALLKPSFSEHLWKDVLN